MPLLVRPWLAVLLAVSWSPRAVTAGPSARLVRRQQLNEARLAQRPQRIVRVAMQVRQNHQPRVAS
jgi:hypothetical protein